MYTSWHSTDATAPATAAERGDAGTTRATAPFQLYPIRVSDGMRGIEILSDEENARAARFGRISDRQRFLAGRAVMRRHVAAALREDPAALSFACGPHGKPYVPGSGELDFNLSHSGDWILFGVTRTHQIGVDVEWMDPAVDVEDLAPEIMTDREVRAFAALSIDVRRPAFFRTWARKESAMKLWGTWLRLPPRQVEIAGGGGGALAAVSEGFPKARLQDVRIAAGYAAAVAYARPLIDT